ncbi:hypothetical protein PISMIDRAFT_315580 [Pisolithus microcarpus 441]|uniref:Uncharacterized protein n=1 Tax=Pisolithus microcarpus 441 TaxID=765257 RepID=A0A0C9ZUV8_9AGAM|nr:hypothetical protein PISMIDRAFT_315580 [Pisolithus microcarpus 441]
MGNAPRHHHHRYAIVCRQGSSVASNVPGWCRRRIGLCCPALLADSFFFSALVLRPGHGVIKWGNQALPPLLCVLVGSSGSDLPRDAVRRHDPPYPNRSLGKGA